MPKASPKLTWCNIRFADDMNWWVKEISDTIHWDSDGLSIVDPRQMSHILDHLDPLREYGLNTDLVDSAFIPFQIKEKNKDGTVRVVRVNETFSESDELLFGLPDVVDEEKGPYADFLDHITKLRVKFLNDNIEFEQKLTVEELEEHIRENQNQAFIEGKALHVFTEVCDILEFVPEGYELADDEDAKKAKASDEDGENVEFVPDVPEVEDEKIEEDETMKWEEDEAEEEEEEEKARPDDSAYDLEAFNDAGSDDDDDDKPKNQTASSGASAKTTNSAAPVLGPIPLRKRRGVFDGRDLRDEPLPFDEPPPGHRERGQDAAHGDEPVAAPDVERRLAKLRRRSGDDHASGAPEIDRTGGVQDRPAAAERRDDTAPAGVAAAEDREPVDAARMAQVAAC